MVKRVRVRKIKREKKRVNEENKREKVIKIREKNEK